jgi:hypothetical protein
MKRHAEQAVNVAEDDAVAQVEHGRRRETFGTSANDTTLPFCCTTNQRLASCGARSSVTAAVNVRFGCARSFA